MLSGIVKEVVDGSGKRYLTDLPPCGSKIRVNHDERVVTMLTTAFAIRGL